jgi:Double-GTPase 2
MNVLCRHCFRLFDFRRVGVLCRSRRCSGVLDTEGRRGPRFMLPDRERGLWAQRGWRLALDAACPYCEQRGRLVPACPRCRNPLDPEIGEVEDRIIGVLGAKDSGKSHYLSTLLHLLLYREVGGDVWEVRMDREARQAAEERLLRPLFDELREIPFTERGPGVELRLVLTHRSDGRRVLLVFRDLSGEFMVDRGLLEEVDFLRYAEGVVLLADPQALGGRVRKDAARAPRQVTCAEILDNYRAALDARPQRPGEEEVAVVPARKFLAVTITKADLVLRPKHGFWSPNGSAHLAPGFWQARAAESRVARDWLHRKLGDPRSFAVAVGEFGDASYFFVSSYGYHHTPHSKTLRKPPKPLRVHEPIFALLDRFASADGEPRRRSHLPRARGSVTAPRPEDEDVL